MPNLPEEWTMTRTSTGRLARAAALSATAIALMAGLTACRGAQAVATSDGAAPASAAASSTAPGNPASTADSIPASSSASGSTTSTTVGQPAVGSLAVSVSSPSVVSGTVPAPVTCLTGPTYRAAGSRLTIRGNQLSFGVTIAGFRGPGTYPALITVTWRQVSGLVTTLAGVFRVPAVITSTGGSFSVSATGIEGRTFTGSLTWVCGS
jgi:hypothetical protein